MTDVIVPAVRGQMTYTDVLSGRAVRAITWQDWAQLVNWVIGRGGNIAPAQGPAVDLAATKTYQTHLLTQGSYAGIQRLWAFWIRADAEPTTVDISINGGTAVTYPVPVTRRGVRPIVVAWDVASQQTAVEAMLFDITPVAEAWLDGVSVIEIPRALLSDATDELGVLLDPFRSGQPIRQADFANGSEILSDDYHGRRHLFSWGVPHLEDAVSYTSFSWRTSSAFVQEVFDLHPPLLARKGVPGETERKVAIRYTALVDTGVTAEVHIGTTSRAPVLAHTITSTSFATYAAQQTVDVEDPDDAAGLQGGVFDGLRMQARRTGGSGSIYIFGIAVYED